VSVADALFHYSSILTSKQESEKELVWAKKQIQLHEMTIEQDKDRFMDLEGEVCGLRHDLDKAQADIEEWQDASERLAEQVCSFKAELAEYRQELQDCAADADKYMTERDAMRGQRDAARDELAEAKQREHYYSSLLAEERAELKELKQMYENLHRLRNAWAKEKFDSKRLRDALEFYEEKVRVATEYNHMDVSLDHESTARKAQRELEVDKGKRARQALAGGQGDTEE
jgi:chromosome segregation ATPase